MFTTKLRLKTEGRCRSKSRVMEFNSGFCPHLWTCPCLLTTTLIKHLTNGYLGLCPCLLTLKLSSFCLSLYLSLALLYMIQKDLQQGVRTTVVAIVLDLIFCNWAANYCHRLGHRWCRICLQALLLMAEMMSSSHTLPACWASELEWPGLCRQSGFVISTRIV